MNKATSEMIKHFSKPENTHQVQGGDVERFVFAVQSRHRRNGVSASEFMAVENQIKDLVNKDLVNQGHKAML